MSISEHKLARLRIWTEIRTYMRWWFCHLRCKCVVSGYRGRDASCVESAQAEFSATDVSLPVYYLHPSLTLHHLCAIPPVTYSLRKLRLSFHERLSCLPPSTLLHSHLSVNQAAYWPSYINPPTRLTSLLPRTLPCYFSPPPFRSLWSHPK